MLLTAHDKMKTFNLQSVGVKKDHALGGSSPKMIYFCFPPSYNLYPYKSILVLYYMIEVLSHQERRLS